jgi:hypothetical protein
MEVVVVLAVNMTSLGMCSEYSGTNLNSRLSVRLQEMHSVKIRVIIVKTVKKSVFDHQTGSGSGFCLGLESLAKPQCQIPKIYFRKENNKIKAPTLLF